MQIIKIPKRGYRVNTIPSLTIGATSKLYISVKGVEMIKLAKGMWVHFYTDSDSDGGDLIYIKSDKDIIDGVSFSLNKKGHAQGDSPFMTNYLRSKYPESVKVKFEIIPADFGKFLLKKME